MLEPERLVGGFELELFAVRGHLLALERLAVREQPFLERVTVGLLVALDAREPA